MSTTSDNVFDVIAEGDEPTLKRVLGPKLLLLFIVGDILGAGVYAVTETTAGAVGGLAWLTFVLAALTAFSYLELVTQYPQAAGAMLSPRTKSIPRRMRAVSRGILVCRLCLAAKRCLPLPVGKKLQTGNIGN